MTTERALIDLLHEALDAEDVAGPFQRLQLQIEKSTGASPGRRIRRNFMTPNRIAVLAVTLIAILLAGLLVGTRLYSDYRSHSSIPATTVSDLLARPLKLSHVAAGQQCPDGPYSAGGFGKGPVYGLDGTQSDSSWGSYWFVGLKADKGIEGPVIFRGQDIVRGYPLTFLGQYGVGPIVGTDTVDGQTLQQYQALQLDTVHPPAGRTWNFYQGFPHGWSGCVEFQVDGPTFTEVFYSGGIAT